VAERYGDGTVRVTVDENVIIPHVPAAKLEAFKAEPLFQKYPLFPGPLTSGLVSCTGAQFCGFALTETKLPAAEIAKELETELDIPQQVREEKMEGRSSPCIFQSIFNGEKRFAASALYF
jgi:ferredoxin-nitrite reductase